VEWTRRESSITAGCFPVSFMPQTAIFLLCLPQKFKAMQSTATLFSMQLASCCWRLWLLAFSITWLHVRNKRCCFSLHWYCW